MWRLLRKNKLKVKIRKENESDYYTIHDVVERAFRNEEISEHDEQYLVTRLRTSDAFIPELSLVASIDDVIVGHILLTRIAIKDDVTVHDSLALAPVSVIPEYQGKGIGSRLIKRAHAIARLEGYKSVVLLGHADYYPRFGYKKAKEYGIQLPFDAPEDICMAMELVKGGLQDVKGVVQYPKEFFN